MKFAPSFTSNHDSPVSHRHTHSGPPSAHESGRWPGVELYYPPIKFVPSTSTYETPEEAEARFWRWGATTKAHTLLFDLEDGCQRKTESRELLRRVLPKLDRPDLLIAVRINPFNTADYHKDLELIADLRDRFQVVLLAKAGEEYGAAEIRDLCSSLVRLNTRIAVEPNIEHPKSLKIVESILAYDPVCHVVFGIHDFSKAMGVRITARHWTDELRIFRDMLLFEARIAGKGVVGGVDALVGKALMPDDLREPEDVEAWLATAGDEEAQVVYRHAKEESQFGLTGKQVIHPYHVPLARAAFVASPKLIERQKRVLSCAIEADALIGGAILFDGEMLDPPMFGKALQDLLKAAALGSLDADSMAFTAKVVGLMPEYALRENWPYNVIL